jgi:class 3 adenylate cyclase/tetratricopeptide (TPR) repeat protein
VSRCASCGHENRQGARFCEACGAALRAAGQPGEQRKTVTLLFCDVTGSTALGERLDPESLRAVLARYFDAARLVVERHGGSVEKFIGDAVMAVFGIPVLHEDDALRAVRAAAELRDGLGALNESLLREYGTTLELRIGVNTGEVVTGTQERLATGDAVNVTARLEQAAQPGEILIGAETRVLAGDAVVVESIDSLELKGKATPVVAYRLIAVGSQPPSRRHAGTMLGRERELARLQAALAQAEADRSCQLFTVLGAAGVGKSRLAYEFLAALDGATVVQGCCLSYGEGITYWPVVEVVKQLDVMPSDQQAAAAIRSLLRESDAAAGTDEIAWAFRKLLEERAPLVVCFDDIQWGEETFLELVESAALLSTGAPLLLLCMARPELLDRRPGWPVTLRLEPLREDQADELVGDTVPDEVRRRIVHASGGNPLFVTEMLALAGESADVEVPATLRALLAARLDQLDEPERRVLERGSVEGELFHHGTVQALAPEETDVVPRLAALMRKELVRPDRPQLPREDAYRFRHLLIRDTAYEALPKATRADLHRRFADWLEQHGQSLVELDEVLGYHLEQASRYLDELGRPEAEVTLAAGDRLAAAGRRAYWRGDDNAATGLLERALQLMRPLRLDVVTELDLAACHLGDPRTAAAICDQAAERAAAEGDIPGEALARAANALYQSWMEPSRVEGLEALALEALPLLEQAEDHAGLAHLWWVLGFGVANENARFDDWTRAQEESFRHARLADRQGSNVPEVPLIYGSLPADEVLTRLEQSEDSLKSWSGLCRSWCLAMLGRFAEAFPLADESYARFREQSRNWIGDWAVAEVASLAGDHESARGHLEEVCRLLETSGQPGFLASYAPRLGIELCALGRHEEAEETARLGRQLGVAHDNWTQALWRQVQARVDANCGEHVEAERPAREAVVVVEHSDSLGWHGDALSCLAEVLEAAGRRDEAVAAWGEALDRYERKQVIPLAALVRKRLAALEPA